VVTSLRAELGELISADYTLIPKLVRLIFHDCVGGCDGCVDLMDPDNAGLLVPILALKPVCSYAGEGGSIPEGSGVTRTDCWVLASFVACELSQDTTQVGFPLYSVGRYECDAEDGIGGPARSLPASTLSPRGLVDYFKAYFNLVDWEIVALLGAHTLGGADKENSGYHGVWTTKPYTLDNEYYASLENVWSQKPGPEPNGLFQWELVAPPGAVYETRVYQDTGCPLLNLPGRGPPVPPTTDFDLCKPLFMLNADIALSKDIGYGLADDGHVDCLWVDQPDYFDPRPPCPDTDGLIQWVLLYKDDNLLWVEHFQQVLLKITDTVAAPLINLGPPPGETYDPLYAAP